MAVRLSDRQMPEPDVVVVTTEALVRKEPASYYFADVLLAVEVVSPDSRERDREIKPVRYARAGIPSYWRVENRDGEAVVYAYELDPATNCYGPVGIFHDHLKIAVPFHTDIDLTTIGERS